MPLRETATEFCQAEIPRPKIMLQYCTVTTVTCVSNIDQIVPGRDTPPASDRKLNLVLFKFLNLVKIANCVIIVALRCLRSEH